MRTGPGLFVVAFRRTGLLAGAQLLAGEGQQFGHLHADLAFRRRDARALQVFEDLKGSGVAASEGEVRMKMAELLAFAREQLRAGE